MIKVIELTTGAKLLVHKRVINLSEKKLVELFGRVHTAAELENRIFDMVGDPA